MFVFANLHGFVASDIQRRSDAWLSGEVEVLGDVAERTPKDRLYLRVVGEVAELASREVPNRQRTSASENENDSVFFLQAPDRGKPNSGSDRVTRPKPSLRSVPPRLKEMFRSMCGSKVSAFHFASLRSASPTEATSISVSPNATNSTSCGTCV
jgi:hypothetical protein